MNKPLPFHKKEEIYAVLRPIIDYSKSNGISTHELVDLITRSQNQILVPLSIFATKLAPLEALVKYLKEIPLSNKKISTLINRDHRVIWTTYDHAKRKLPSKFDITEEQYFLPLSIFSDLSVLESVVKYLHNEEKLSFSEIATLLHRSPSTIYTVYSRGKSKHQLR